MAIPEPSVLIDLVKPVFDTAETFIAKLTEQMEDPQLVKDGYRGNGIFNFYVPGVFQNDTATIELGKALKEAGWQLRAADQQVGFMPPNLVVDFKASGPYDPDVTGPSTFPWISVRISKLV